ncbi:MAG TPA: SIMPL domain-containing protein [Gaiellaceae bacterium]|nr:SIMPL domain-containing protein [Gaiellaceae bacterium]
MPPQADDADPAAPTVTVRGDALLRTEPDEALLWITLSALADAPGPALSDVSARSGRLLELLDEVGVGEAERSTTGATVYEDFDHTKAGRRSLGHRAVSRVSVRLNDPAPIGELIARATSDLAARIEGPQWLISLDNPARLEAARRAAADARRKAQAFAEGVGARLGSLIRLSEPGDRHVAFATGLRAAPREPMPVEPGEHEVAASVEATFALELDADE